jgi:RimJ/RimL family protein N-acetyltransferase
MKFSSARLNIIEFHPELLNDKVLTWFQNPDLMRYYTNSKNEITKENLLNSIIQGKKDGNNFTYFIVHTETETIIGTIKLGPINKVHKISDLVALIGETGFGKGIGTEAISLGVKLAFEKYDIRKLFGGMYESNIGSIKAYTRAGWIVEGKLHGHYLNNETNEDRILVGCFNPKYFTKGEIINAKSKQWYDEN